MQRRFGKVLAKFSQATTRNTTHCTSSSLLITPLFDLLRLFSYLGHFLQMKIFNNQATAQNAFKEFTGSRYPEFYDTEM